MKLSYKEYTQAVKEEIAMFNRANGTDIQYGFGDISVLEKEHNFPGKSEIEFEVNWAACGNQPADEANRFANKLMSAACLANHLTYKKYEIDWSL